MPIRMSDGVGVVQPFAPSLSQRNSPRAGEAEARALGGTSGVVEQPLDRGGELVRIVRTTSAPAPPCTSGSAPRSAATTGTPAVIASSTGMPKPSSNDGCTRQLAPCVQRAPVAPDRRSRCAVTSASSGGRCDPFEPGPRRVGRLAGEHELGADRAAAREQPLVRVEQPADVLARLERAEEQHVAVRGRPLRAASSRGAPGGQTAMRSAGTPSSRSTSPAVNCDDDDDRVGRLRVLARQRRVVAADLGARALGMREEIRDRGS